MAVTFVGAGALAGNNTDASQSISSHADTAIGDILICQLINKSVTANAFSPPDGTWTAVIATEVNDCSTTADDHQYGLYWKRATAAGAQAFTFTKATDDNVLFAGVISAWRGAVGSGSPLDATAALRTETATPVDALVTFPAYDPTSTDVHVVFMAYYGNDVTTFAAAMSADTNPDCTTRYDLETSTGTDASFACTSGDNDGSNVASRTWSSGTGFAGNTGVVFALVAAPVTQGLTPSLYDDSDSFFSPTVAATYVLTPSVYTDGDTFYSPTVAMPGSSQDLQPPLYTDADTFYAPTVTAGSVNLAPSLYDDGTDAFHAPTVAAFYALTPNLYSDDDTFFAAAVAATYGLTPALYDDADSFHAASVAATYALTSALYTDADTFFTPQVAIGPSNLQPSLYVDDDTFYAATVGRFRLATHVGVDGGGTRMGTRIGGAPRSSSRAGGAPRSSSRAGGGPRIKAH